MKEELLLENVSFLLEIILILDLSNLLERFLTKHKQLKQLLSAFVFSTFMDLRDLRLMKRQGTKTGEMAEWSIASDLKSDEPKRFREFESHSLLVFTTYYQR